MSCIFQNVAQMQNRYPDNAWMEIIGACDTQLFLGCTDELTAKFISDRTGEITIGVESMAREVHAVRLSNYVPTHRETSSIGKRKLLTPDEVLRLPKEEALVILRGQKVLKVNKFDFTKHPESKKLRDCNARDYIPNWRTAETQTMDATVYDAPISQNSPRPVTNAVRKDAGSTTAISAAKGKKTTPDDEPKLMPQAIAKSKTNRIRDSDTTVQKASVDKMGQLVPTDANTLAVDTPKRKLIKSDNQISLDELDMPSHKEPAKINTLAIEDIEQNEGNEPFEVIDIDDILTGL